MTQITIKIDHDVDSKGEAMTYLRQIAQRIDKGFVVGEGWEVSFTDREDTPDPQNSQNSGGTGNETINDEETVDIEANTPPEDGEQATEEIEENLIKTNEKEVADDNKKPSWWNK